MAVKSYQDLLAWQKAMELAERVYRLTAGYPNSELYGLTAHTRKSAVSVPSNIAEGQGRRSVPDFKRFLSIAYGSLLETETQILLGSRLGFLDAPSQSELLRLVGEAGRLINGLSRSLSRSQEPTIGDESPTTDN
jgi:four helix bundle protein